MKMNELTKQALRYRRDHRDMRAAGWEYIDERGGRLWQLHRGFRIGHRITDVRISADGLGLWIKTEEDLTPFRGARGGGWAKEQGAA